MKKRIKANDLFLIEEINVDQILISKTLAAGLKKFLPFLICPGQTAFVNGRFIGESGRLIPDMTETCNLEKLEDHLAAVDFKKAFDFLNHGFLVTALEHCGFGNRFIK